ncbi:amidohydrolase family protein [Bradyrhizobium yuanmingense]|uniref:amidohydrolase family protein n=1 Tax=Bradyrhizobium yuanmingense TaxID=108015 RepID=UPI0023B95DAC|nr:amidohydrolase family protein [Bradyrhizobium yuanmingense]MDF0523326.1 amidohydrolase family protein [Bradyrhizobium yuanmingense]
MSMQTSRVASDGMVVVDCDIHLNDLPQYLAPYCEMPWRKSLEQLGRTPQRYLDIPGYSPSFGQTPPLPGGHPVRSVDTPQAMRDELDTLGVDYGIVLPDHLLLFATLSNIEYATALSRAYNRWLVAEWLREGNGLYGAVMACPQNPDDSAKEIERYAGVPGIVAVYLPTAGVDPLWGHRRYDRILAAAEAAELPVMLHSVTVTSPAFPTQLNQFENQFGRQVLGHPFAMMANLVSMMHTGVPVRYPKLNIVFTEAGVGWAPFMMWRMDRYHQEYRRSVPFLEERPSDYVKRQMWFATQPLEEPVNAKHLVETMEHYGGADRTLFASDWPHHDFDHPRGLARLPLTQEQRRKIMGENALSLFKLPKPERLAKKEKQLV